MSGNNTKRKLSDTQTVLTRGTAWGANALYDSEAWGEGVNVEAAGDAVIREFHRIAEQNGSEAIWYPTISEVMGPIDDPADADDLNAWREQADEMVMNRVRYGNPELSLTEEDEEED